MKTITIVVKPPGKPAYEAQMEDSLSAMQDIVGGYIERLGDMATGVGAGIDLYANEEAKIRPGFEENVWLYNMHDQIWGTFFFVGGSAATGDICSLTSSQVSAALGWCARATV